MLAWDQLRPVVLGRIGGAEVVASELRERLRAQGLDVSPLVFRGMLGTLEKSGLVAGRYLPDEAIRDSAENRRYRLTPRGVAELASAPTGIREAA